MTHSYPANNEKCHNADSKKNQNDKTVHLYCLLH